MVMLSAGEFMERIVQSAAEGPDLHLALQVRGPALHPGDMRIPREIWLMMFEIA